MLQIDEKQLQVYSCSFQLTIAKAYIPLKVNEARYFIEWKVKNGKTKIQSRQQQINQSGVVQFQQTLKIHTEILKNIRTQQFLKKYTKLTLFLISSKQPDRPKIVGSMLVSMHEILNLKIYSLFQKHRLSLSAVDSYLQFKCNAIQCQVSSILEANLHAALIADENFLTKSSLRSYSYQEQANSKDLNFMKKKATAEYLAEDDQISRGDCSMIQQNFEDSSEFLCVNEPNGSHHFLINSGSIQSEPFFQRKIHNDQEFSQRIKEMECHDLQFLVKQNTNLKRLLMVQKKERKFEYERFEEDFRQLARQLSIKQAELMKISQSHQTGTLKLGELLDEATGSTQKKLDFRKENEILKQQLQIQRQLNKELGENYLRLENRLKLVQVWQQQKKTFFQRIKQLQEQNEILKVKNADLQSLKCGKEEQSNRTIMELNKKNVQMNRQLSKKDQIISLYQEKISKFEEEISYLQEEEVISRVQYSASSSTLHQQEIRRNKATHIREASINEGLERLRHIKEEENEDSIISVQAEKQIATADELPESNEADFYRKMARNVQEQLDQLRVLYRGKEVIISKERTTSKSLYEQLQRLRFQFVYELSKVTALLNEKIIEIRQLKEENIKIRQRDYTEYERKIYQLQNQASALQEQKLEYFDKCYKLSEQNIALIHLNKEKQEVYQSILRAPEESQAGDTIAQQFQRIVGFMLKNEDKYQNVIQKYGLLKSCQTATKESNQQIAAPYQNINTSDIIKKYSMDYNLSDSDSMSNSIRLQQELLLESNAQVPPQSAGSSENNSFLLKMLDELSSLSLEREKGVSCLKELMAKSAIIPEAKQSISPLFQILKKTILKVSPQQQRMSLLKTARDLQACLSTFVDFY